MRLLLLLLLAVPAWAGPTVRLTILHTNDLHGQLEPMPPSPVNPVARNRPVGGFAALATMVDRIRSECAARKEPVLLLDAGDLFQGTPIGNESRGDSVVDCMNVLAYDAVAAGNHDFDFGLANFLRLAGRARFPFLSANLTGTKSAFELIKPLALFGPPRLPCRVAVLGLMTPSLHELTAGQLRRSVVVGDFVATARTLTKETEADLFIALTHLGGDLDRALAREVPRLGLIVGGHSHTPMNERVNGVPIVQTHAKGLSLGRVDLDLDPDGWKVAGFRAELLSVDPGATPPEPAVREVIDRYRATLTAHLKEVVGRLEAPARRKRGLVSSPAGNWVADVIRTAGRADIGIMNKGGLRVDLEAGDVTAEDVYRLMPFDNTIECMDLTGKQIRALFEGGGATTGFPGLEWSGMEVVLEAGRPPKILSLRAGGAELEEGKSYRVATNSFLAAGGDGYRIFLEGARRESTGLLLRDAIAADLKARSPLLPPDEARLKVLEASPK